MHGRSRMTIVGVWGGDSFVACLVGHLTIDHASLSRRSTVPTPDRGTDLQHLGAHYAFSMYYLKTVYLVSYPEGGGVTVP